MSKVSSSKHPSNMSGGAKVAQKRPETKREPAGSLLGAEPGSAEVRNTAAANTGDAETLSAGDPYGLLDGFEKSLAAMSADDLRSHHWTMVRMFAATMNSAGGIAVPAPAGLYSPLAPAEDAVATSATAEICAAAPPDAEVCAQCGERMHRGANDLEYVCDGCGLIVEGDTTGLEEDEAGRPAPNTGRLRIVGPNSNQLQPDLYRSGTGNTIAAQKKQIFEEYKVYRAMYIENGGRAFPLNACEQATEYYNEVQRQFVKRSQNKKAIMACCLWRACLQIGFAPSKAEIADFMQLPSKGIARGENFVRKLIADGKMDIEANADPCRPEIVTLFAHLSFESDAYNGLRDAVHDVVQTAIKNNIGTNSILRSKVAGAAFVVLRRCQNRSLIAKPMSLQEFCQNRIRKNTVERFTRQLDAFHSFFEGCYARAGLDASPPR